MKKFISIFLSLILLITFAGPYQMANAATIKINKTSLLLYAGDTATLKITGTTKTVKWSSNNNSIATVSSKGKVAAKGTGRTLIIGKVGNKNYSCKIEVKSSNTADRLFEINNFVTDSIWNKGFCDIGWYISSGTDSIGGKLDIDKTLKDLDSSMTQLSVYDKYISSLNGGEYDSLKASWDDLYKESLSLYNTIKELLPTPNDENSPFNSDNFIKYSDAFSDECSYFN